MKELKVYLKMLEMVEQKLRFFINENTIKTVNVIVVLVLVMKRISFSTIMKLECIYIWQIVLNDPFHLKLRFILRLIEKVINLCNLKSFNLNNTL